MPTPLPPSVSPIPASALAADATSLPHAWNSLPIPSCLAQLTSIFALQREMMRTEAAWLPGVPYWDAKQAIARHVLEGAHHAEATLKRLHELKVTSAQNKQVTGIEELVRDIASAANGDEWLQGLYGVFKPWLATQLEIYLGAGDPVMDEPTHVIFRRTVADLRSQIAWFATYQPRFSPWAGVSTTQWTEYLQRRLAATRVTDGMVTTAELVRRPDCHPDFQGISRVQRDSTFRIANKSDFPREGATFAEKRFLIFYNHTQEMQFAESLCAILYETAEMPWSFHYDLARHMADEVRHATMGQTRLEQLGVQLHQLPMLTQHYEFRSNLNPLERFCLMTLVMEGTAFERKRGNADLFEEHGDRVSALYENYDIKDEMLHTNLGHVWVPIMLRVYHDSRSVPELTEHCRAQIAQVITEYPANAANMLKR